MKTTFLTDYSVNTQKPNTACVLTVGNFDGLHLGHQAMVNKTLTLAYEQNIRATVMVFEPMPKEFFSPTTAPVRLMNQAETIHAFNNYEINNRKIDELIIVDFNENFRKLSAQDFVDLLVNRLGVQAMVIGDDFRFGNDRKGNFAFLRAAGLDVTSINTVTNPLASQEAITNKKTHARISSTRIRQLLKSGDLSEANILLGRDYFMIGEVKHGDKIGRTLDFPTANISLQRLKPALHGVFAVDVQMLDDNDNVVTDAWTNLNNKDNIGVSGFAKHSLFGAANIGTRPAVNGKEWRLEVHFPKFKGDLYHKKLKVRFLHYLHGEREYSGLDELKVGIHQDVVDLLAWRRKQIANSK